MKLSPRRKYHLLVWVAWPVGAAILAIPMFLVSPWFFVVVVGWAIWLEVVTDRIPCPSCGKRIAWGQYRVLGIRFNWWRLVVPRYCDQCGNDISATSAARTAASVAPKPASGHQST